MCVLPITITYWSHLHIKSPQKDENPNRGIRVFLYPKLMKYLLELSILDNKSKFTLFLTVSSKNALNTSDVHIARDLSHVILIYGLAWKWVLCTILWVWLIIVTEKWSTLCPGFKWMLTNLIILLGLWGSVSSF